MIHLTIPATRVSYDLHLGLALWHDAARTIINPSFAFVIGRHLAGGYTARRGWWLVRA